MSFRAPRPVVRFALAAVVFTAVAALVLASADVAWARGGGGGGYGGGGGDGGGGGGDGGGWFLFEILFWLLQYPVIGIPTLIVVLIVVIATGKKGTSAYQGGVIRRGSVALVGARHAEALAALRARDPGFDETQFAGRVRNAFLEVQSAWCDHDLAPMRPFTSDGIHERFALQIREQEDLGYRDQMDDVAVLDVRLAQVTTEGPFDVVTARVAANAKDRRVSLADGKRISGTDLLETFVEYWSFLRRRGRTTTPGQAGLMEGQCPNCGAAIEMNQWSACTYCKAMLRSGEFDWVLAEITQDVEWRDTPPEVVPGVEALRTRDPDFVLQHLEDRASVMFWRAATAERLGTLAPLRKIASPEFADAFAKRLAGPDVGEGGRAGGATGARRWYGERAVGSVDTLGIALADGDSDRAFVEVRWQGTLFAQEAGGKPVRGEKGLVTHTVFALSRRADVRSDPGTSVSSAHCPHCGAPESGGESDACEQCGEVLNDRSRDWVLDAIFSRDSLEGRAALAALRTSTGVAPVAAPGGGDDGFVVPPRRPVRAACLAWMVGVATSDGTVDDKERAILVGLAEKAGMRRDALDSLVAASLAHESGFAPKPASVSEARDWLDAAAEVALADGRLDRAEWHLLVDLGAANGFSRADVSLVIRKARARLYQGAKAALRFAASAPPPADVSGA